MPLWVKLLNFVEMGTSSAEIWCYVDFQDGGRCDAILLPVSDRVWLRSFSDVSFYQQIKFHRYNYSPRLRFSVSKTKRPPLQFYFWFRFRPHHRSRHVILHQSEKFYQNRTAHGRKMTSCRFSRWRIFAILDFRGPIMGSLKSPCTTTYYRSSIETIALNCLVFEKIAFLHFDDTYRTNR